MVKFKDDLLMITTHPEGDDKIVVPNNFQSGLLKTSHKMDDSGMDFTESRLKLNYYWYNMQADTQLFVQSCTSCQVSKLTRNVVNNRNLSGVKNDQVSPDFIGPLQRTTNDVSYCMRLLARLVNQVRKDCGNNNLSSTDIIGPKMFHQVVRATR